jgi:nucleoside 2-deoxyribosyltransferase
MIRAYLAGASAEYELVSRVAERLTASGKYSITYPWWVDVAKALGEGRDANRGMSLEEAHAFAQADLRAIESSDVFWLLMPRTTSTGCFVELGYAMRQKLGAAGVPHLVVSFDFERSIFSSFADCRFPDHDAALAHLLEAAS